MPRNPAQYMSSTDYFQAGSDTILGTGDELSDGYRQTHRLAYPEDAKTWFRVGDPVTAGIEHHIKSNLLLAPF